MIDRGGWRNNGAYLRRALGSLKPGECCRVPEVIIDEAVKEKALSAFDVIGSVHPQDRDEFIRQLEERFDVTIGRDYEADAGIAYIAKKSRHPERFR